MITSLFLFFVLGPVLGFAGICAFALISQYFWFGAADDGADFKSALCSVPKTFHSNKAASWITIGAECVVLFLVSPLLGYLLTLSAIGSLLLLATGCACAKDNEFRGSVNRAISLVRNLVALRIERWREAKGRTLAPTPAPARNPLPKATVAASQPLPKATAAPRSVGVVRDGDAALLSQLLEQVTKLQRWTVRPDAEKRQITELVAATSAAETALRTAAEQLKDGTVDWNGITAHVDALKGHNLPDDVAATLDKLVADRASAVSAKKDEVGTLAGNLDGRRAALDELVTKSQLSPEEALAAAKSALTEAAELTKPAGEADSAK